MDLEDVEEMSTDELVLAQNTRRKSTRRSLLPIPVVSHSNSSSPKVLVRRRSLGWPLYGISNSPGPSATTARKSLDLQPDSFREHHKKPDSLNNFKPAKSDLPPLNDQPPSQISECPILARVDQPPSKVPESSHSNNQVDPCVCTDQRTVVGSAEELYDRYVEELTEWPKFLSGLEDLANHHVEITAISNEAIDENPVLAPFSRYLYPGSQGSLTKGGKSNICSSQESGPTGNNGAQGSVLNSCPLRGIRISFPRKKSSAGCLHSVLSMVQTSLRHNVLICSKYPSEDELPNRIFFFGGYAELCTQPFRSCWTQLTSTQSAGQSVLTSRYFARLTGHEMSLSGPSTSFGLA
ncbi:hypothetical protein SprV_0200754400 [Sparganum proliferum]